MRTAPALLIVLAATLALTGCQPDDSPLVVDPSPSVTPIFESDEEALAAAEAALLLYYETSDQVLADGGEGTERLEEVSTKDIYVPESASHQQMIDRGWHAVGGTQVDTVSLQYFDPSAAPQEEAVVIYACVDISGLDIVDSAGLSVVSPSRSVRTPFEFGFLFSVDQKKLLLSHKEAWTGEDYCAG